MSITFYAGHNEGGCIGPVYPFNVLASSFWPEDPDGDPTPNPNYRPELDITMPNAKAARVLRLLGIEMEDYSFMVDIKEFAIRVSVLQASLSEWDDDYLDRVVPRLATLASVGAAEGATLIYGA